jgi:hypothetical protein
MEAEVHLGSIFLWAEAVGGTRLFAYQFAAKPRCQLSDWMCADRASKRIFRFGEIIDMAASETHSLYSGTHDNHAGPCG